MKRVVLAVGLAACGSVSSNKMDAGPVDSPNQVDAPPDSTSRRCDPTKPFGSPVPLDGVNSTMDDLWPSLSPDELTVYFMTNRGGAGSTGGFDIFVSTRPSLTSAFATPAPLANVNYNLDDETPSITADGKFLYTNRKSSSGDWDIYVAQRASTSVDFGAAMRIDSLNGTTTTVSDENEYVLPNNSAVYFITTRTGDEEIYRATRNAGGTFDTATSTMIRPTTAEASAVVTPDELTMYFGTDATPTLGSYDIWMTKRNATSDPWGTPTHVTELSTSLGDTVTAISADGCDIYLSTAVSGNATDIFWARKPM